MEGIIIRLRTRWHEHGERNSKYFLNIEKRNHVRKHIRKLFLSGVISTDPSEILEAERAFYENLYKSRRDGSEVNKPNFNSEDLTIPTLSNASSDLGVCKKVLNSFPLNKVPENDWLPIELYKTFWDFIGDPLVASFNESFVKRKLSSSQRQAVITRPRSLWS